MDYSTELKNLHQSKLKYLKTLHHCPDLDKKSPAFVASLFFFHVVKKHTITVASVYAEKHAWRWSPWYSEEKTHHQTKYDPIEKKSIDLNQSVKSLQQRQQQLNYIRKRFRQLKFQPPQSINTQYGIFINALDKRLKKGEFPKIAWDDSGWEIIAGRDSSGKI